jgi:NADH-quinone oxidoreductase subunit N
LLITSTIIVVMLAIAWRRNHSQTFLLSCAGLNLACCRSCRRRSRRWR